MTSGDSGSGSGKPPRGPEAQSVGLGRVAQKTMVAQVPIGSRRNRGVFTVTSGTDVGKVISIPDSGLSTLGRSDECTLRFDDTGLSRVHAQVMRIGPEFTIVDAGSTNGTYVNDEKIAAPLLLRDGDRVQLGSTTSLRFSLVDEAEEAALKKVYEQAVRDGLTGVSNRKHLEERLDNEVAFALRHGVPLSVLMLDVDHFKRVNDTYGHLVGDTVLKHVGALLQRVIRVEDLVARYGGEEFVVVARGADARNAVSFGERLRHEIERARVVHEPHTLAVTVSVGVASLADCGQRQDKAALLGAADARLYRAKQAGRNRVVGP